ncbi:hypothetical protein [Kitasatospora sp. NPDC057198]|uniref:hypothetical protein n=1 Tax=Kitasatospora sp. NPDC057198 TaxID=3346046 RepID=UPI003635899E
MEIGLPEQFGPKARAALVGAAMGVVTLLELWVAVLSERSCEFVGCLTDTEVWLLLFAPPGFVLLGGLLLRLVRLEHPWSSAFVAGLLALVLLPPLTAVTLDLPHAWLLSPPYLTVCFVAAARLCGRFASRSARLLLAATLVALILVVFRLPFPHDPNPAHTPAPAGPPADTLPR